VIFLSLTVVKNVVNMVYMALESDSNRGIVIIFNNSSYANIKNSAHF